MRYLADPTIPTKGEADLRLRIDEEQKKLTETATVSIPLTRQESGIELKLPSIQIGPCEILQGDSPGGIVIKTVVRACDSDRFNELADESLDEMYDILTLLTGEKNLQPRFCVKTKIYRIEKKDGGTESHSIDYGHSINPMIINEKFVEFFERSKLLSTINEIYTSDPKQRYNKKIKLAMRWFGSALRTERKVITYLHLIEVFETLLKNNEERQELKRIIQQRAAFILKTRYNYDVVDIHRFIGEAYSKRSTIIHQGDMDETDEKNIQTLEAIARTIIFDFLHRHNALKDFGPAEYKAFFEKMDEEILESLQFMQSDKAQQTGSAVETKKANGL